MRIGALLTDYDGTLAPTEVPREESRVPRGLEAVLENLKGKTMVGIVTAKDYRFVFPRTRFASAWACVEGLEITTADSKCEEVAGLKDISEVLAQAGSMAEDGTVVETKMGTSGRILGFSLDWRSGSRPDPEALNRLKRLGRKVGYLADHEKESFIDVFAQRPDKGRAVRRLRTLLRPKGGVMFIGDSPRDNLAYREAEVSVAVEHGQDLSDLRCRFVVSRAELPLFLQALVDKDMEFTPGLPWIRKKGD